MSAAFYLLPKTEEDAVDIDMTMLPASEAPPRLKPEVAAVKPPKSKKAGKLAGGPKKPPQRGMGVAQLERLRTLDERWKKISQFSELHPGDAGAQLLLHKVKRGECSISNAFAEVYPNIWASAFGGGAPPQINPAVKTDQGELSPTQNLAPSSNTSDHQSIKKKWSHNDVLLGLMRQMGSSSRPTDEESSGLGFAGARSADQKISYVHAFGASSNLLLPSYGLRVPASTVDFGAYEMIGGSGEPTEYEFFPRKLEDGSSDAATMGHEQAVCEGAASSSSTASPSTFIDLSLKLSCY